MKSILLFANLDSGLEARLQAALDAVRLFGGHLVCLQVTPFDGYIMADPFGGVYALPSAMKEVRRAEEEHRAAIEKRLRVEGVSWNWVRLDGSPGQYVVDRARLCDLIVLTLPAAEGGEDEEKSPVGLLSEVAVHARAPLLAVPHESRGCDLAGVAAVAWNGSPESAHALRLALPALTRASAVHILTVTDDASGFPATEACEYLSRHGIASELYPSAREGRSTAAALADAAGSVAAEYLVMGAYGHTRLREAVLGGVTRAMLLRSTLPLLLAH